MIIVSAITGTQRSPDRKAPSDEVVSPKDAADAPTMGRLLTRMLRTISDLRRPFMPRRIDFEDLEVGSGTKHRLAHGFGGRVRWWVVDADSAPVLVTDASTDAQTLVLGSSAIAKVTIRVEEAG